MIKGGVQIDLSENGYMVHLVRPDGYVRSGPRAVRTDGGIESDETWVFLSLGSAMRFAEKYLKDPNVVMREKDQNRQDQDRAE